VIHCISRYGIFVEFDAKENVKIKSGDWVAGLYTAPPSSLFTSASTTVPLKNSGFIPV
jgi:hypothetical protein